MVYSVRVHRFEDGGDLTEQRDLNPFLEAKGVLSSRGSDPPLSLRGIGYRGKPLTLERLKAFGQSLGFTAHENIHRHVGYRNASSETLTI